MAQPYIARHIRALSLAHACIQLGARMRTTSYITGLTHSELCRLYLPGERVFRCGRLPGSTDWIMDKTNCVVKAELSIFASIFTRLLQQGFCPGEAVVTAYRLYASACADLPRVSFDRAFDIACHLKGLWAHPSVSIALYPCAKCRSLYLSTVGNQAPGSSGCIFCRLLVRYRKDRRIQSSFPNRCDNRRSDCSTVIAGAAADL